MEAIIKGTPEEIAALVVAVQGQRVTTSEYLESLKKAYGEMSQHSRYELIGILREFNYWAWPELLGRPPVENWERLPNYRKPWMPKDTVTKEFYIKPYADAIMVLGVSHWDTIGK